MFVGVPKSARATRLFLIIRQRSFLRQESLVLVSAKLSSSFLWKTLLVGTFPVWNIYSRHYDFIALIHRLPLYHWGRPCARKWVRWERTKAQLGPIWVLAAAIRPGHPGCSKSSNGTQLRLCLISADQSARTWLSSMTLPLFSVS